MLEQEKSGEQHEKTLNIPGSLNTISIVEKSGKRRWQYAMQPKGRLYNLRTITSIIYLVIFFTLPFIKYKGSPLFMFNFPERVFIIFGKIFMPQDFLVLVVTFLVAILFIIVFTLVYGRVFCGWACPQTIFLEMVFRKIEYWIEGDGPKQKKADQGKWTTGMYVRKAIKHIIYFLISFLIANTFLAYIIGVDEVLKIAREPISEHLVGFLAIIIFTIVFYSVFAFIREIVCIVICPYGRLQSVLLDRNSIVVAYDYLRGEPRSRKRGAGVENTGDCIDCNMCVNVCPTGIDIRNGTQLDCVNCTACIDACNMMMKKVNRAPDLIKYASENNIASGQPQKITYRIKAYSAALLVLLGLWVTLLVTRTIFDSRVLRTAGQVMQQNTDGSVSNLYRLKVTNKSRMTEPFSIKLDDPNATLKVVGKNLPDSLKSGQQIDEAFFITRPMSAIKDRKEELKLEIKRGEEVVKTEDVIFIGRY